MNREAFEESILACLKTDRSLHPESQAEDVVKLIFQAMLGVGHLLTDRETIANRIAQEMQKLQPNPEEPLLEAIGPSWSRLNLRRAMADGLTPDAIAGMMRYPGPKDGFTRDDVRDFCERIAAVGLAPMLPAEQLDIIRRGDWLPSHSKRYRECYNPAYRLIPAGWTALIDAVRRICDAQRQKRHVLVTIDGPCASGKTTMAQMLGGAFRTAVIHTDDFVVPHAMKTPERLAIPGGNCDWERLVSEVAAPWKDGMSSGFRRYDCRNDCLLPAEALPDGQILILEGSYCNLPEIRRYADVRLFADVPEGVRMDRLRKRESKESLQRFIERWIPLENAYFAAYQLPDEGCVTVRPTGKLLP